MDLSDEFRALVWNSEEVERAAAIAILAHSGQYRRDGVTPYVLHPMAVALLVPEEYKAVAWLHDVFEDCEGWGEEDLRGLGVSERVIVAVRVLTKVCGEGYEAYLERVKGNGDAVVVKIADMLHNMSGNPSERARLRYERGLRVLREFRESLGLV